MCAAMEIVWLGLLTLNLAITEELLNANNFVTLRSFKVKKILFVHYFNERWRSIFTPSPWLTRICFTRISLIRIFKKFPFLTYYEIEIHSLTHISLHVVIFCLTRLFPRAKISFNQGVVVLSFKTTYISSLFLFVTEAVYFFSFFLS